MATVQAGTRSLATETATPRRSRISLRRREAISGYLFVLPAVLGFFLWTAGPMVFSAWISFHEWDLLRDPEWTGLGNYRRMLDDPLFWKSLRVTFAFVFIFVPVFQLLSFAISLLLNASARGISFFRTAYYLPTIVPIVASSVLWSWVFNSEFGLLNSVIRRFGFTKILWLQDPDYALFSIHRDVALDLRRHHGHLPRRPPGHPSTPLRGRRHRWRRPVAEACATSPCR